MCLELHSAEMASTMITILEFADQTTLTVRPATFGMLELVAVKAVGSVVAPVMNVGILAADAVKVSADRAHENRFTVLREVTTIQ